MIVAAGLGTRLRPLTVADTRELAAFIPSLPVPERSHREIQKWCTRTLEEKLDPQSKHGEFLFPSVANYYEESLVLESGEGVRLTDVDGRTYLDFFGGILTVSIGHCDPRVTGALKAQIDRLGHVSTLYPTMPIVELAERLARITPGRLKKSFFTATGTEADETAGLVAEVLRHRDDRTVLDELEGRIRKLAGAFPPYPEGFPGHV